MRTPQQEMIGVQLPDDNGLFELTRGAKRYELTNHLGNVLSVITDTKQAVYDNPPTVLAYYQSTIISYTDYYPFGAPMDHGSSTTDRSWSGGYRYGFGGHERIDEVQGSGNSIDLGERMYDPRLGRTPSVDKKGNLYADISPYAYAGNNPKRYIDPDGNIIVDPQTKKFVVKVDGEWKSIQSIDADGKITFGTVSDKFNTQTRPYLEILNKSEVGRKNVEYLQAIPTLVTIDPSLTDPKPGDASTVEPSGELTKDGFYEAVNIIPDNGIIKANAEVAGISIEEKTSGVLAVEVGHLKPSQVKIDQGNGSFAKKYNGLFNDHLRAQISYRKENNIALDESLFKPTDKFKDSGFNLDKDLQTARDEVNKK